MTIQLAGAPFNSFSSPTSQLNPFSPVNPYNPTNPANPLYQVNGTDADGTEKSEAEKKREKELHEREEALAPYIAATVLAIFYLTVIVFCRRAIGGFLSRIWKRFKWWDKGDGDGGGAAGSGGGSTPPVTRVPPESGGTSRIAGFRQSREAAMVAQAPQTQSPALQARPGSQMMIQGASVMRQIVSPLAAPVGVMLTPMRVVANIR
jgi:hypothetical protein